MRERPVEELEVRGVRRRRWGNGRHEGRGLKLRDREEKVCVMMQVVIRSP